MSYIIEASPIGVDLTQVGIGSTTAEKLIPAFAVGTRIKANDGVYQYVKASGTVAQYDLVKISNTFTIASGTTTLLPSTEPAKVGVANQTAFIVNQYGWIFVGPGLVTVNVKTLCAADVKLYTHATAGHVDDTATTLVNGLKVITTVGGADAASACVAECELGTVLA